VHTVAAHEHVIGRVALTWRSGADVPPVHPATLRRSHLRDSDAGRVVAASPDENRHHGSAPDGIYTSDTTKHHGTA
jgi:hypothetical protein